VLRSQPNATPPRGGASSIHRWIGRSFVVASLTVSACAAEGEDGRTEPEAERMSLGRVHVVLEPGDADGEGDPDALEVTARFAWVRGLEEDFVRARLGMPPLVSEVLRPGDCRASEQLAIAPSSEPAPDAELVLLDAGDLAVAFGEQQVRVPLALVPDLLPYMSGVEYLYYGDELPDLPEGRSPLTVSASGSLTDELPSFQVEGQVPAGLELVVEADTAREPALVLAWAAADGAGREDREPLSLRITGLIGDQPAGIEITCAVEDRGSARLDLATLQAFGLSPEADGYRVLASRIAVSTFDAGDFAGSELVVERTESGTTPRG
jgi:hypothetical protein